MKSIWSKRECSVIIIATTYKTIIFEIYKSSKVTELLYTKLTNNIPKVFPSVGRGCQVATSFSRETSGKFRRRPYCELCLGKQRTRVPILRPKSGKVHRDFDSVASRAESGKQVPSLKPKDACFFDEIRVTMP